MANNFITNNQTHKTLKGRLNTLISISEELKFLVGYFYFSGWKELVDSLKGNKTLTLKLLVGLEVGRQTNSLLKQVYEYGVADDTRSQDDYFDAFMTSMGFAINGDMMDTQEFYEQVVFFLEMLQEERLIIRKTENPNHAKLYLFRYNYAQRLLHGTGEFITGSSNLTRSGLYGQEEFNVEIRDYGFEDAEAYFDELWERAIPISEAEDRKDFLIRFIQHKSQAAVITPFEAYVLILKTFLDLQQTKHLKPRVEQILEKIGFKKFSYQADAVNQAISMIEEYNGVIIADVVGLGKSVIASMIAKNLGKRGMIICPPGLIGDKTLSTGWWEYVNNFELYDWEVESRGRLVTLAENIADKDIDVVIVDEAHYFRNQDTADYEALLTICRERQVILLTATPFNNSPTDIFSLLKLFIIPGKSGITIEDNLEGLFSMYNYRFSRLSQITKNYQSTDAKKARKAESLYQEMIDEALPIDITKVRAATHLLANQIKNVISPVIIRRNRLDLKYDYQYSQEVGELSTVRDPEELFYYLTPKQNEFYDKVIKIYFAENGQFTGAIYQPFSYEEKIDDEEKLDEAGNRAFQQQKNLYDFMRRLLVKRFESSFGAFSKTIDRFLKVHEVVQKFIESSKGKYIMDRKLMEKIYENDEEEILETLYQFENDLLDKKVPKNNTVYNIHDFELKDEFLAAIEKDRKLFEQIQEELEALNIVENDPKRDSVYEEISKIIAAEPDRKIIVFSEYVDTVKHLEKYLRERLKSKLLVCDGKVSRTLAKELNANFNAQFKGTQTDNFNVLVTSDKLSEGFNLNRAGLIINYDIPWNPTRVIQRVGRINRIGTKVFEELYIQNFFPSEMGADIVKSRQIASQKMFLIHSALGEDSKIFEAAEEPTPSGLYQKVNTSPDEDGEVNFITQIRNKYQAIEAEYPEIIEKIEHLPPRIKTAKGFDKNQLTVLQRKGLSLFAQVVENPSKEKNEVEQVLFEEYLPFVACEYDEPRLDLSDNFWTAYETIKAHKPKHKRVKSALALETKAHDNLKIGLKIIDAKETDLAEFMKVLITDIKKYHTLSDRTLGRLGRKNLSRKSNAKEKKAFFDEVKWIRNQFGSDYLERILKRVEGQNSEVIIAVENVKP